MALPEGGPKKAEPFVFIKFFQKVVDDLKGHL